MKLKTCYRYLIFAFLFLLTGVLTENNILFPRFDKSYAQRFQKVFSKKEKELTNVISEIEKSGILKDNIQPFNTELFDYINLLDKKGMVLLIYQKGVLKFWSDNAVPISPDYSNNNIDSTFVYLKNAWYVPITHKNKYATIIGLIQIKQVYPIENKLLDNGFQSDFDFPKSVKISSKVLPNSFPIVNCNNRYLFSLVFDRNAFHSFYQLYVPAFCYAAFILFILMFVFHYVRAVETAPKRRWVFLLFLVITFLVKYLMIKLKVPYVFYELQMFNPMYFATSEILASLGDLLLWAALIFFFSFIFYKEFDIPKGLLQYKSKPILKYLDLFIHLTLLFLFFYWVFYVFKSIILNSTISFELNKLLTFDIFSLVGYIIIILLFSSFAFYFDKILLHFKDHFSFNQFTVSFYAGVFFWALILWLAWHSINALTLLFFLIFTLIVIYIRFRLKRGYYYSSLILIAFLFAIFTVIFVNEYSKIKNDNNKRVLLTNLANEHDAIADYLLSDKIQGTIESDSALARMTTNKYFDYEALRRYLKIKYFNGYFDKYDFWVTVCGSADSLYLDPPDDTYVPCYAFFNNMITTKGTMVPKTNFYYIDNLDAKIYYLGWFKFKESDTSSVSLFIELTSKLVNEELGYPELLLDERLSNRIRFKDFSYAKYYKGQLVSQYGENKYNLSSKAYDSAKTDFSTLRIRRFDHMVYRPNKDTLIVLSSLAVTFFDLLISFSYTFVIYFILLTLVIVFNNLPLIKQNLQPNFKNKIQYSMMAVLFGSLIVIGSGTLYYNIRQYYAKHNAIISEKLQSIYIELQQKLGHEDKISPDMNPFPYNNLNELLSRFSNVFYIDINLYDKRGNLLATSRPEIFEKGLIGTKIDPKAYKGLVNDNMAEVIHDEQIGKLKYLSAYVPFKNDDNKLLAFINVPYFTRQEELTAEVSGMIVAVVNIYVVLLLITFLIAVILSRKITLPLTLIQKRFSEIKLGQKYEKIDYKSNDEIGGLVDEYNRMVSELERSVEMLARSERESAWREMAKQIAHEINNPLTPMKLSVQHLQRARVDKMEKFDEYLDRISKTLVDEIDNLSAIATEFSNFAKMPKAINQKLDLIEKIRNVVNLYSNSEVDFVLHLNGLNSLMIYADKEQVSRVFINLFKNAIQSVDKNVKPLIRIDLATDKYFVEIRVTDNGKGIPKEMQGKLFRPNFTTKTSGMGLGLAIVKNVIEESGGTITYETEEKKGTTFIIRLPLYQME